MQIQEYSYTKISSVPKVPGLYAWYLLLSPNTDFKEYHSIYKKEELLSTVKGNLQINYEGILHSREYLFKEDIRDKKLLQTAIQAFSSPIYIGISKNLNRRLDEHRNMLNAYLYSNVENSFSSKTITELEIDTTKESSFFAKRVGSQIKELRGLKLNSFRVKTLELEEDYSIDQIREVEKFLNRTFVPLYGRN